jgi:hypothetical protein
MRSLLDSETKREGGKGGHRIQNGLPLYKVQESGVKGHQIRRPFHSHVHFSELVWSNQGDKSSLVPRKLLGNATYGHDGGKICQK